jgi:hypothetical protein
MNLSRRVTALLLTSSILVSLRTVSALAATTEENMEESSQGTAELKKANYYDAVYVYSCSKNKAVLYIDGKLVRNVTIANYNKNATYSGLMEASVYNSERNSIKLYDTIPATSNIDYAYKIVTHTEQKSPFDITTVLDSKTLIGGSISVNGITYALAKDISYYAVNGNGTISKLDGFQIALNRYVDDANYSGVPAGYPDYTAAAVYFNSHGDVAAIYYVNNPTTYPTSKEFTYGKTDAVDQTDSTKGSIGINQYGVVTQSGVFGIYDSNINLVSYLAGARTNTFKMGNYNGLASTEVALEYMPAVIPFLNYMQTADPNVNTSQSIDRNHTQIVVASGTENTSAVLANGGSADLGVASIHSGSKLNSDIINSASNSGTKYDTWNNAKALAGASNNPAYFNVKTNEIGSQWGVNAVLYSINGGVITVGSAKGERTTITADADSDSANLTFATTLGSEIAIYNADLLGYGSGAHATDVTYGGHIYAENAYMETLKGTSSILTTDFGGSTVEAKNITGIAHAKGSGGSYIEGGDWTKVDNTDWANQIFQTSKDAIAFYQKLTSNEKWGVETLQNQYRGTNLIFSAADGGACVSHFGWVEYDTVDTGGAYGVLVMNRAANSDNTTSLYGHYYLKDGSLTSFGEANKANSQKENFTAAVAFYGGAAYVRVENSLVTINTAEKQKNYLVYAATNSFMSYNFDADGYLEFRNENGTKALKGDIAADAGVDTANKANVSLVNSQWSGAAYVTNTGISNKNPNAGKISLSLDKNSTWIVTGPSQLASLSVAYGATVKGMISAESFTTSSDGTATYTNAVVVPN